MQFFASPLACERTGVHLNTYRGLFLNIFKFKAKQPAVYRNNVYRFKTYWQNKTLLYLRANYVPHAVDGGGAGKHFTLYNDSARHDFNRARNK